MCRNEKKLPACALDCLSLVEDHVLPFNSIEILVVGDDELVARDDNVEGSFFRVEILRVPKLS